MTLYEEFLKGLNPVVYCEMAYNNLLKAVMITAKEEVYDKRDIKILWELVKNTGHLELFAKKQEIIDMLTSTFNIIDKQIDSRLLAMIRDFEEKSIQDFIKIYCTQIDKAIIKDQDRLIKTNNYNNDSNLLDCMATKGPRRFNNEDFTCAIESPLNSNYKLLIVCDGVGGSYQGEKAAEIVTKEFISWFNDFNHNFDQIENEINIVINKARDIIKKEYIMSATTLTFAIVGQTETFIGNIGDSRAYIIKDGKLKQISKDDSEVWEKYYESERDPFEKDDLRFLPANNIITNAIDVYPIEKIQKYRLLNTSYDGILLMSDGITDILSDRTITRILNNTKSHKILDTLLYESCFGEPSYPSESYDELLYPTLPGKDNASAAIYLKETNKKK